MRYATGLILGLGLLMCSCSSRHEVLRLTSPDGSTDAVVYKTDCGAPCSFGYEIRLARRGGDSAEKVASLAGAMRSERAWGVDLKWLDADSLSIEYLRADYANLVKPAAEIDGHSIKISLRPGVDDAKAPSGGMLNNLRGQSRN